MRLLVFEYVCGGGLAAAPLPPILADAVWMLQAQLADACALPGLRVRSLLDARLNLNVPPAVEVQRVQAGGFAAAFAAALDWADAVWLTAPESDGVLERLSERVRAAGRRLLGCAPEAVRVAGSKRATARCLERAGVPVVPTVTRVEALDAQPLVVKPDDGAGGQDTRRCATRGAARRWARRHLGARAVFQPWLAGEPRSLSLLCAEGRARLLAVNRQHVALRDGLVRFEGVTVNAYADQDGGYQELAARIAAALPGLWGHVGVDFVDTRHGPVVLEVNPRPTVSYAGLHRALGRNPLADLLALPDLPPPARGSAAVELRLAHEELAHVA
ncbi:MAG: ATP-grasp domain-containing protein [Nevskia sp.]|nr:ATP-grasp domain-containing protein [Nevskia sp.]